MITGRRIPLVKLLGFEVDLDISWLVVGMLILLSLAVGVFPQLLPDYPLLLHWLMALITLAGFVISIVLHELSHSLVARRYGIRIYRITLFLFGGVAQLEGEPGSPRAEIATAIAGPAASIAIAFVLQSGAWLVGTATVNPWQSVLQYLATLNVVLAVFNMVPAFPLDGGRVLRGALWAWRGDLIWATRWASRCGVTFGVMLALLGTVLTLNGQLGGIWWILMGLFIRGAAINGYQLQRMEQNLADHKVADIMEEGIAPVPAYWKMAEAQVQHGRLYRRQIFPVVDFDGRPVGIIDLAAARRSGSTLAQQRVDELMIPLTAENVIPADCPASKALKRLMGGQAALVVLDHGQLLGMLYPEDFSEDYMDQRLSGPPRGRS